MKEASLHEVSVGDRPSRAAVFVSRRWEIHYKHTFGDLERERERSSRYEGVNIGLMQNMLCYATSAATYASFRRSISVTAAAAALALLWSL